MASIGIHGAAASSGGTDVEITGPLGQDTMANSVPVVIASDQTAVPVSISSVALTSPAPSPTSASVGTSSASAVASNSSRLGLVLVNLSDYEISLGFGVTAVVGSGVTLMPNGGTLTMGGGQIFRGAINAISTAASSALSIQEFT